MRKSKTEVKSGKKRKKEKIILADSYVRRLWQNLREPGTALSSITQFLKSRNGAINVKELAKSLAKIDAYSMHKRVRHHYKRPAYIIHTTRTSFCSDLADVSDLAKSNSSIHFLLVSLDQFSKKLSVIGLRSKSATDVLKGMKLAIKQLNPKPNANWVTDSGREFRNRLVLDLMKKHKINFYESKTSQKSAYCEGAIKQLKSDIYKYMSNNSTKKYIDVLSLLTDLHNNRKHTVTGIEPNKVNDKVEGVVFSRMYARLIKKPRAPPSFQIGDKVRLSSGRIVFQKFYKAAFSKEKFIISGLKDTYPVWTYLLTTESGIPVDSSFTKEELSLAS